MLCCVIIRKKICAKADWKHSVFFLVSHKVIKLVFSLVRKSSNRSSAIKKKEKETVNAFIWLRDVHVFPSPTAAVKEPPGCFTLVIPAGTLSDPVRKFGAGRTRRREVVNKGPSNLKNSPYSCQVTRSCQAELNSEMLRHRCAINNVDSSARGSLFKEGVLFSLRAFFHFQCF